MKLTMLLTGLLLATVPTLASVAFADADDLPLSPANSSTEVR